MHIAIVTLVIAICMLIIAVITFLHKFRAFEKINDYYRERKVHDLIKVTFSPPEGKIAWQDGYGLINIFVVLSNSRPYKEFTNIRGKFWTNKAIYDSSTNIRPQKVHPAVPALYFPFSVDILHKKTGITLTSLTLKIPKKKAGYILGADLIARELDDWKAFGYPLKVEDDTFKIEYK